MIFSAFQWVQRGVTLVELIISIVIISVGLAGIIVVINRNVLSSADPMVQHQAVAIAEAYLEEILAKEFNDPDGTNVGETRATFDNVADYNGLPDNVVRDQSGNAIAGLGQYTVTAQVVNQDLSGTGAANALLVTVTVTGPGNINFVLSGYRTNYQ